MRKGYLEETLLMVNTRSPKSTTAKKKKTKNKKANENEGKENQEENRASCRDKSKQRQNIDRSSKKVGLKTTSEDIKESTALVHRDQVDRHSSARRGITSHKVV